MKNRIAKPLSLILCLVLFIGGVSAGTIYALAGEKTDELWEIKKPSLTAEDHGGEFTKDETVYVLTGADGSVRKIIVSDWIKNAVGSDLIVDKSELTNVENVKGNETYTMNEDSMRVWDTQGNDIYYQGNIEKELPVTLTVSYTLDGKTVSAEDLAGKSGKVTIRFNYKNNQFKTVEIDGKQEKIYVPFAMLTGMLLDNNVFKNVEVSNGKLINDGNRTIVAGIAFPGLQENLCLDTDKLKIPDYVEITADVKNFEMMNTVTIAANSVFSKLDTENLNSVDGLLGSLDGLTDAMSQLLDGSSQLYDGLCTLLDKSKELISGIDKLAEGAAQLKAGAASLKDGSSDLAEGAGALASGLDQLMSNNDSLNNGAAQVFESLLSMADMQISAAGISVPKLTIKNYAMVLANVIASLDEANVRAQAEQIALENITNAVNAQRETITADVTSAVGVQVEEQVIAAMGMTKDEYDAGVAGGVISEEQQAQVDEAIKAQMASSGVQTLIAEKTEEEIRKLIKQNMDSPEVRGQITTAVEQAKAGAESLSALKMQLDNYYAFYSGLLSYTAGVASADRGAHQVSDGANALKAGSAELNAGMQELYNGLLTLKDGAPALTEGVSALRDGAMQLSDGLKKFNEEGVQKLVNAVNENLIGTLTRIKATVDVSKEYISFSGISEEMDGEVKFIYRTDEIKAD